MSIIQSTRKKSYLANLVGLNDCIYVRSPWKQIGLCLCMLYKAIYIKALVFWRNGKLV